jgi:hypothetical protein
MSFVENEDPQEICAAIKTHLLARSDTPEDLIDHLNDECEFDIIKRGGKYIVTWYSHARLKCHPLLMDEDQDNEELEGQLYWLSEHQGDLDSGPDDEELEHDEHEHEDV